MSEASNKDSAESKQDSAEKPKDDIASEERPVHDSQSTTDFLREYLARSLGLREKPESKLEEMNLSGIAKYMQSDQCQRIVTMAGAGISTSAGIPDFRSPGTGLYDNLASYNLPTPQSIFDLAFFQENPRPFFVLAKELMPGSFKPTPCHYFIKLLGDKGKLLRHYTQNIDTLERVAGLDPDKLVEAHGTFHSAHCQTCQKEFSFPWMKEQILSDKIPKCELEDCDGVVKPDIVFFGERLPDRFATLVEKDLRQCDLLIVMGTSLTVQPFASLVNRVPLDTPRLYINLEKGMGVSNPISALMFGGGFEFDSEDNYRDIFKEATCDEGCLELADLLGWGDSLRELVQKEHSRIDNLCPADCDESKRPPKGASGGSATKPAATGGSKPTTPAAKKPAAARPADKSKSPSCKPASKPASKKS